MHLELQSPGKETMTCKKLEMSKPYYLPFVLGAKLFTKLCSMELRPVNVARMVKDLLCEPEDLRLSWSFHCGTACILKSQERFCSQRPLVACGKSPMSSPPQTSAHRLVLSWFRSCSGRPAVQASQVKLPCHF